MINEIIVRYGEIFLKSERVRKIFERILIRNIKAKIPGVKVEVLRGRIFLQVEQGDIEKSIERLKEIFGIVSFSPAIRIEQDIVEFFKENYEKFIPEGKTFAIRAKTKKLEEKLGAIPKGRKVNLEKPDITIFVEERENGTHIYFEKIRGLGGLPVGSSGKVLSLISGGIDSPVASYLMMKRGCQVYFIHFHSFPFVSRKSIDKTIDIVKILRKYLPTKTILYLVPFWEVQEEIILNSPKRIRVVLYRRFMMRIAEAVAKMCGAGALVTGESLGQVSSQTLHNIKLIEVVSIPIFRPLISYDKEEIVKVAKEIGTYEISILPQEDCCTIFVPKHSSANAPQKLVEETEEKIKEKISQKIEKILQKIEKIEI